MRWWAWRLRMEDEKMCKISSERGWEEAVWGLNNPSRYILRNLTSSQEARPTLYHHLPENHTWVSSKEPFGKYSESELMILTPFSCSLCKLLVSIVLNAVDFPLPTYSVADSMDKGMQVWLTAFRGGMNTLQKCVGFFLFVTSKWGRMYS